TRCFPVLLRRKFPLRPDLRDDHLPALTWFGTDRQPPHWNDPEARVLCVLLDGAGAPSASGDYLLFVIMNARSDPQWLQLPPPREALRWARVVDTSLPAGEDFLDPGREMTNEPTDQSIANTRRVVVLQARRVGAAGTSRRGP